MTRIIFPLILATAALVSSPAAAQAVEIANDAPDVHVVVPGDTLWSISGRFLREPWRWPEVWRLNSEQISNPHLIFPGQVIMLDRSGPYLTLGQRITSDQRLSPRVIDEPIESAIPSIPVHLIAPFLTRPLVVDERNMADAGTVIATETSRVIMGSGDIIFAKNIVPGDPNWQVVRPAQPLVDPVTRETLGYEAAFLGNARVTEYGTPATLRISDAAEEIGTGDLLVQMDPPRVFSYVPHPAPVDLEGRVISLPRGVVETGRHNVITLNVGGHDGIDEGHVVALYRNRGNVVFKEPNARRGETFVLPEHRYGLAFVFRVFNRVSYALVMDADGPVTIGDSVRTP